MFKATRKTANLSIEQASLMLHIGYRTLVNYENGHSITPPEIVLTMEKVYGAPGLYAKYCSDVCPIGQKYAHRNGESGIACATLSLMREIDDARRVIASKLVDVAADDLIEPHELPDLKEVLIKLIKAEKAINAVKLIAAKHIDIDELMPEKRKTPAAIAVAETRACYKT